MRLADAANLADVRCCDFGEAFLLALFKTLSADAVGNGLAARRRIGWDSVNGHSAATDSDWASPNELNSISTGSLSSAMGGSSGLPPLRISTAA